MFTVKDFPGREFKNIEEYKEAVALRAQVERRLEVGAVEKKPAEVKVVASIAPLPPESIEVRLREVEVKLEKVVQRVFRKKPAAAQGTNVEGIPIGEILNGDSKGRHYTVEVLPDSYLCSDGNIYESLSGAALGVSGNRRSGWKFWKGQDGRSIGEIVGRFYPEMEELQSSE